MEAVILGILGAWTAYFSWRSKQHSKNVDKKTDTNHGREPWQYLEMVMEVRDDVLDMKADVLKVREAQHNIAKTQEDLHESLVAHTEQDAENFESLALLITNADDLALSTAANLASKVEATADALSLREGNPR